MRNQRASGPLRPHPENPRFFGDGNRPIYLTGAHTWSNLQDMGESDPPGRFDFDAYLAFLEAHEHNFVRLWTWGLFKWAYDAGARYTEPLPWPRTGPGLALDGKPRFDLEASDETYLGRLRARVQAAGRRGIYVSVMLFEGHGQHASRAPWCWDGHPFNPQNNVNGVDGDPDQTGRGLDTHTLRIPAITAIQEAYVRRLVVALNDLDNMLFEIANESGSYSVAWQYHMIDTIHQAERDLPKQHPVGMTFPYHREDPGTNADLWQSPADWISPNPYGGYRDDPPAADGSKVILSDTDHLWGIGGNRAWVWKTFCRGMNPIFMDPYRERSDPDAPSYPKGCWTEHLNDLPVLDERWDDVRWNLGYTLRYAERIDLAASRPLGSLTSTGYCLAVPGAEYLVYAPDGGAFQVDVGSTLRQLQVEWFNPNSGGIARGEPIASEGVVTLAAPFDGDSVLYLSAVPG